MSENNYNLLDKLNGEADSRFGGGNASFTLTLIILLSGILSAIFFWKNSSLVFTGIHPTLALLLGLLVGLVPAEGAFFGWKSVRGQKTDLTQKQLKLTAAGLVTSVVSSIFSTFALYIASFTYVPEELSAYDSWLVFIALSLPLMSQVAIYAWYTVEERSVVENHERAKLKALGFDAYVRSERAKIMATIRGTERELEERLDAYGEETGRETADRLLAQDRQGRTDRRPYRGGGGGLNGVPFARDGGRYNPE